MPRKNATLVMRHNSFANGILQVKETDADKVSHDHDGICVVLYIAGEPLRWLQLRQSAFMFSVRGEEWRDGAEA